MISVGAFLLYALAFYVAVGLVTALAFVAFGVTRVLASPAPVSIGARVLLFPAAAALWPVILKRWLSAPVRP